MTIKTVFDEFIKINSSLFNNNQQEISHRIGRISNNGSLYLLIGPKNNLILRIKKIIGKKIFGGYKWEWEEYELNSNDLKIGHYSDFLLNNDEVTIFQNIKTLPKQIEKLHNEINQEKTLGKFSKTQYSEDILLPIKKIHHFDKNEIVEIVKGKTEFEFWFHSKKINSLDKKNQEELFFELCRQTSKFKRDWVIKKNSPLKFLFKESYTSEMSFTLSIKISNQYIVIHFDDIKLGKKNKQLFFVKVIQKLNKIYFKILPKQLLKFENEKKKNKKLNINRENTRLKKDDLIKKFDKDSDGIIDIIQTDDFLELLKKHEKYIVGIDRSYIKNFVKLSNYLKTKRNNLQNTFDILSKVEFSKDLQVLTKILKNKIHTYNTIIFHSISMIVSLTSDEMIIFYEIYEIFDELNVYDSKSEKDLLNEIKNINSELKKVNKNLKNIGDKLDRISGQFYDLMNQINESDERIINTINNLTYTTSSSIESLSNNVQSELKSIDSSIKFNNLLTGIQSYQMYKINLNTKSTYGGSL